MDETLQIPAIHTTSLYIGTETHTKQEPLFCKEAWPRINESWHKMSGQDGAVSLCTPSIKKKPDFFKIYATTEL